MASSSGSTETGGARVFSEFLWLADFPIGQVAATSALTSLLIHAACQPRFEPLSRQRSRSWERQCWDLELFICEGGRAAKAS